MFTNHPAYASVRDKLMSTNRLGTGFCCALAFTGIFFILHTDTNQASPVPLVTIPLCIPGQKQDGLKCVEPQPVSQPQPVIHIDAAPAFACLTPEGTFGDRLIEGVCADKHVIEADLVVKRGSTNPVAQRSTR
jgi:hypothetical protein